jgi:hypothetical protein
MRVQSGLAAKARLAARALLRRGPWGLALVAVTVGALVAVVPRGARTQSRSRFAHHRPVDVPTPGGGPTQRVLVSWPRRSGGMFSARERWPILIALHGAREAALPPSRGCLAWSVDYALDPALGALVRGMLTSANYGGLVTPSRLEAVNAALRSRPFRGIFVVTPYTPPFRGVGSPESRAWGDWLAGPVLAAVRAAFPAAATRDGAGIDGVSLGGRLALDVGLAHPEAFGTVGALQPAFDEVAMHALVDAAAARPASLPQRIRVLTSDGDTGRAGAQALSASLRERRVAHELQVATGTHGYAFNRGPGALEMLLFHDGALAAEPIVASRPR